MWVSGWSDGLPSSHPSFPLVDALVLRHDLSSVCLPLCLGPRGRHPLSAPGPGLEYGVSDAGPTGRDSGLPSSVPTNTTSLYRLSSVPCPWWAPTRVVVVSIPCRLLGRPHTPGRTPGEPHPTPSRLGPDFLPKTDHVPDRVGDPTGGETEDLSRCEGSGFHGPSLDQTWVARL